MHSQVYLLCAAGACEGKSEHDMSSPGACWQGPAFPVMGGWTAGRGAPQASYQFPTSQHLEDIIRVPAAPATAWRCFSLKYTNTGKPHVSAAHLSPVDRYVSFCDCIVNCVYSNVNRQ